ncbi:MAG: DUF2177 family protein [Bosea sp. (in: a-proteobacteria)]
MPLFFFAITTALVFCAGDFVVIPLVMQPLFKAALGSQMLDQLRLWSAALFYIIHIGGLVWFAGRPAVRGGTARGALIDGAILGFVAYSCYEMTSWTIMRDWTPALVVVDLTWGTVISGAAAFAGAKAAALLPNLRTP